MSELATNSSTGQASTAAPGNGQVATTPRQAADRFQRPESYTSALQRQNLALQDQVAELHQQVRDLQLALVVERALGVVNVKMRFLPSPSSVVAAALTRKKS